MTQKTDRDRLRAVFAEFRRLGYWAREAQQDGWDAVPEDRLRMAGKVVFWHVREAPGAFDEDGFLNKELHLRHFEKDTEEVAKVMSQFGFKCRIDKTKRGGVIVVPMRSTRA